MRGLRNIINQFRYIQGNRVLAGAFFAVGLLSFGFLGLSQYTATQAATARDCDDNAIMRCGAMDANEFRTKYNQNAAGDLPAIYGHYWIPRDIQVIEGQSFRDGTVRVNGRIVAKNATSIGRQAIKGSHPISIAGKTYYETANAQAFLSDGLATMVALDAEGNFKYAVIKACGNPIYATPVPPVKPPVTPPVTPPAPTYSCTSLTKLDISNTQKRFSAQAAAANGATISGYTFDFGDGSQQTLANATVDHAYKTPGTYTAKVTVNVTVNGTQKTATAPACQVQVTIPAPANYACTALTLIGKGNNTYDVTINETHSNATYKGATIDFGDGTSKQVTGLTATHQYGKAGNYTITATLSFSVDGAVKTATCQAQVSMTPCPTNPNIPVDSPDCKACPQNPSLPADSPKCVTPPVVTPPTPTTPEVLPTTGPGDMVMGGLGIGSMIISASFYLGSRRDLFAALGR